MRKSCNKCGHIGPLDDFYKRKESRDGHDNKCKNCAKQKVRDFIANQTPEDRLKRLDSDRERSRIKRGPLKTISGVCGSCEEDFTYVRVSAPRKFCSDECKRIGTPEHREQQRQYAKYRYREVADWLSNYKLERGCADCGYNLAPEALELDHEGPKRREIASLRHSIQSLKDEIREGKCVVRCANCHAIKTLAVKRGTWNKGI